jgi:hypothetical protein
MCYLHAGDALPATAWKTATIARSGRYRRPRLHEDMIKLNDVSSKVRQIAVKNIGPGGVLTLVPGACIALAASGRVPPDVTGLDAAVKRGAGGITGGREWCRCLPRRSSWPGRRSRCHTGRERSGYAARSR